MSIAKKNIIFNEIVTQLQHIHNKLDNEDFYSAGYFLGTLKRELDQFCLPPEILNEILEEREEDQEEDDDEYDEYKDYCQFWEKTIKQAKWDLKSQEEKTKIFNQGCDFNSFQELKNEISHLKCKLDLQVNVNINLNKQIENQQKAHQSLLKDFIEINKNKECLEELINSLMLKADIHHVSLQKEINAFNHFNSDKSKIIKRNMI